MYRFLVGVIGWLVRGFGRLLASIGLRLLRLMAQLSLVSLTSLVVGTPKAIDRMADSWTEQATEAGVPVNQHPGMRTTAQVVATIVVVTGWLVVAVVVIGLLILVL